MCAKERNEIPVEIAARVLFLSHRICCVCRKPDKPVQIHHIDEDPSNSQESNLAVLCFDCHHQTQTRGGFARKLDAHQIVLYRDDWLAIVGRARYGAESPSEPKAIGQNRAPGVIEVRLQGRLVHLSYLKVTEKDDEHGYVFDADYPQLSPEDSAAALETNIGIAAFVTRELQRFRAGGIETSSQKKQMASEFPKRMSWDSMSISHTVSMFTEDLLSLEFRLGFYGAGAAHPNMLTRNLNYLLDPAVQLELGDLFRHDADYLRTLSKYCITSLHEQQPQHLREACSGESNDWILKGAAPEPSNFDKFSLEHGGIRLYFDPYSVACYAEGRYEVLVPISVLGSVMKDSLLGILV